MTQHHVRVEYPHLSGLQARVGEALGISDWLAIEQPRIRQFADATGDHQWIHLDAERAAAGPFGTTIAHGFLTLSLIPLLASSAYHVADVRMGVNYGLNRVRFTAPVPVDSLVRARFTLLAYEVIEGGAQLVTKAEIEREGSPKPVCVAEPVVRMFV